MSDLPLVAQPGVRPPPTAETLVWLIVRRFRYLVGIVVAIALWMLAWPLLEPATNYSGVSLLLWNHGTEILTVSDIVLIMLISTLAGMFIVHPDAPHTGLLCTTLGLTAVSIRGGSARLLVSYIQHQNFARASTLLAVECAQWVILLLITAMLSGWIYNRQFANNRWILRTGAKNKTPDKPISRTDGPPVGIAENVSKSTGLINLPTFIATPLAMVAAAIITALCLFMFLQSPLKGQVLFACFLSSFFASLFSYLLFPRVNPLAYFCTPLLVAAIGYLFGMHYEGFYPGLAGMPIAYALPIDFASAGVSGAIIGYYSSFRWSLHTQE